LTRLSAKRRRNGAFCETNVGGGVGFEFSKWVSGHV
jgi:hypothetical protein